MTADGKWLTIKEAAERLGCSPGCIRDLRARGALVCRRIARLVQVSVESLDDYERRAVEQRRAS